MDERAVVAALVKGREHLYTTNAWFKAGVDAFAKLCDVFVEGLEVQAEEKNDRFQRDLAAIQAGVARLVDEAHDAEA